MPAASVAAGTRLRVIPSGNRAAVRGLIEADVVRPSV